MTLDTRLAEIDLANPTYLLISGKDELSNVVPLKAGASVFVGTGSNCKVQLDDESVQQLHCMFCLGDNNVLKVQDWNTGATYLNGDLVSEETVMQSGDVVSVGCYCFTAVLDAGFHQGIAVELLGGDGAFSKPDDETIGFGLPTNADQIPDESPQIAAVEPTSVMSSFSSGDDSNKNDVEMNPAREAGFKYDIDADLEEGSASMGAFDSLPTDLKVAFGGGNDAINDETSLLLMEVEQLRFELADRDSQILAFKNKSDSLAQTPMVDDSDTLKLVARLEELSEELKTSDDRIQSLEDLLRLSEEAASAERDDRARMEKLITEIENRVGQRQIEAQAEVDNLTKQLKLAREDTVVLQTQLHSLTTDGVENQDAAVAALNAQVEELRVSLKQSNEKNQALLSRQVQTEAETDSHAKLSEAQDEVARLRLEASKVRAETARRHVELENVRGELERQLSQSPSNRDDGDSRIRAMRDHLREIQQQERAAKAEQKGDGLGGRIANLLSRSR